MSAIFSIDGIEYKVEIERSVYNFTSGGFVEGLRFFWRRQGQRNWHKRIAICEAGQTPELLAEHAEEIVLKLAGRAAS